MLQRFYSLRKQEKILARTLCRLGIGIGGEVDSSGESVAMKLLLSHAFFTQTQNPLCIFDVGANKGKYTTMCLQQMGGGGKPCLEYQIHCFEPSQYTFEQLECAHKQNPRVILNNYGLSHKETEAVLYSNADGSGLASLAKRRLDHFNIDFNQTENIQLGTLDTYCKNHNIEHIHLLKLDVEGHETCVLEGGEAMFQGRQIDMVTFEFGGCNIDTRTFFQDFWYFFLDYNMRIYRIMSNGTLYYIDSYRETLEQFTTTNYIAIKNECEIKKPILVK